MLTNSLRQRPLAAVGCTAAEVIACLESKLAKRKYRPGGRHGPRVWNWFYTVIQERVPKGLNGEATQDYTIEVQAVHNGNSG
jgi:hypothetical protein